MGDLFAGPREMLRHAAETRIFPAATVEVGTATQPLWQDAIGRLTFSPEAPATTLDTIFDLASLTKVLATTPLVMGAVEDGSLGLDDGVHRHLPRWSGADRAGVTLRDLLSHASGLPAHRPYYLTRSGRDAYERAICVEPLEYEPRSTAVYSDLGFMLLGFLFDRDRALADRTDALLRQIDGARDLRFHPPEAWVGRTAPTAFDPWRNRLLAGEVDDGNAAALGGAAGHAGLFGTAAAVGAVARHLLRILGGGAGLFRDETVRTFATRRAEVPGSRALGWDTMLPTSSCGTRLSPRAFGHTGFTGTSLWIDPDRGIYVVLLTNRVHPSREHSGIQEVRRALHDAVVERLDR